ncbi:MAG: hypothetical protein ACKOPM_04810 [Novosphingobium sp.]
MKLPPRTTRRGQPLTALAILLLGWVGARTALWAGLPQETEEPAALVAPVASKPAQSGTASPAASPGASRRARPHAAPHAADPPPPPVTTVPIDPGAAPTTQIEQPVPPRIAAGHQLLYMAGMADMPLPEDAVAADQGRSAPSPPVPYLPTAREQARRWSADGWILWREGGNGFNLPGAGLPGASLPSGAYGSSQAGMVLRYRLIPDSDHRPSLYLRASSGLYRPRGEELALGLALRPLPKLPVALMAEGRVTRTASGDVVRPAFAAVTELPPADLPLGLRGEAYGQAGWVGGKDKTPFIDGQVRLDKAVARSGNSQFRLGAGAWGGAQKGASRLDMGPSASFDLPVGGVNTRLSADYRFRVAGDAAPGSGAAVTFSAGF